MSGIGSVATDGAPAALLRVHHVTKSFPGAVALEDVSLECLPGEVLALVGENGAGKSTLIKILAGAYHPDSGWIEFAGSRYEGLTPELSRRLGISVIHQEFNLIPEMTVTENMFLGTELRGRLGTLDRRRMAARAQDALARLGSRLDVQAPVAALSVVEQQLVEIARALLAEARLVIMDEPSAVLAGHELQRLLEAVSALRSHGVSIVYVSHRLKEIFQVCDRVTVLKDGRVVGTRPVAEVDNDGLIQMMIGRSLSATFPPPGRQPGGVVLKVTDLSAEGFLHGVGFELREGEILGIGGLVGSGRTTLARALFGVAECQGTIEVDGLPRELSSPAAAIASGLTFVPEDRKEAGLVLGQPVRFNLSLPHVVRLSRAGLVNRAAENGLVRRLIELVHLRPPEPERDATYLSGGNQQKVVLAKWLVSRPRVAILDEPTRGIDVGAKAEIYRLMRGLADEGSAVIMISSDLLELLGMSDRILVFCEGSLAGEISHDEASEEAVMRLATQHGGAEVATA